MEESKSLDNLFKLKIFRIPDYQRGYAWQQKQLKDFWEDLINLPDERYHYVGVLTLKQIPAQKIKENEKEFWLVNDHSYHVYHVVDGQQRLMTFIIFLQAFINFLKSMPENSGKPDHEIYITDSLSVLDVQNMYLFKTKPRGDRFRTYKFGYTVDDPSYDYLRYMIFGEAGAPLVQETFYTLNLSNAKKYFSEQFMELYNHDHSTGLQEIYRTLTKRFLFNEYVIKDEFDVFVAFETMNNRGKKLSDLELLKNRLIYLTTLYDNAELDKAARRSLRETINGGWKEVYHQLGRNKLKPLNDDDFLRAHWIMYLSYSRKTGRDYIRFLLDEKFAPQKIRKKIEKIIDLEIPEEQHSEADFIEPEDGNDDILKENSTVSVAQLKPTEIRDFVLSLKSSAVHWFDTFYPRMAIDMSEEEREWIDRLNRIGMAYFRPLVMSVLKNEEDEALRIRLYNRIERFIFIAFRIAGARSNYRSSEFYNVAREFDRGRITIDEIAERLDERLSYTFNEDGSFRPDQFSNLLYQKFKDGSGYYGWSGLRYFLFEYELSLLSESIQRKVEWDDLKKTPKDTISIEHIYPQSETDEWEKMFAGVDPAKRANYRATLGNLLLLSAAINSSLQNDPFEEKKRAKYSADGVKIRNGYSDGSHSEIEVSRETEWGPRQIRERGIRLLSFMEKRWDLSFSSDEEKEKLLFLDFERTSAG